MRVASSCTLGVESECAMTAIRVLVADDHRAMREALTAVFAADPRFHVVGEACTVSETLELASVCCPDVVLLDVRMPGGGPDAVRATVGCCAHDGRPPVVVVVSASTRSHTVRAMLEAGAGGYLAKGGRGDLPDLVDRCVHGERVLAVPAAARLEAGT